MSENFSFINNGKKESIDFGKLKDGLKKEDIASNDQALGSIFDSADTDSNKVLDKKELNVFQQAIKTIAKDNQISQQEAQEYSTKDGQKLGVANGKNLFKFLDKLNSTTKNIKSIQSQNVDGKEAEVTTFKDGHTETVFPDGSKILTLLKNGSKSETKLDKDGKKIKTTTTNATKGTTISEEFDGDKVTKKTVEDHRNGTTEEYSQINGELKLSKKSNSKDNTITNYEYQDNKTLEYKEDTTGNKISTTKTVEENGNKTVTEYDKDNHEMSQSYTPKGGKTQTANYDESGNTKVVVQKGENGSALGAKYGVSMEGLCAANGKKKGEVFAGGSTIIIPKHIDATDESIKNNLSADEIKGNQQAEEKRHKADVAKQKFAKAMDTTEGKKTLFKKGPVYTDRVGNQYVLVPNSAKQGKGRVLAVNAKGEYCVVSQGKHFKTQAEAQKNAKNSAVVLDKNYVTNTNLFTSKKSKKITVNGQQYAILGNRNDGHGRMIVVNARGQQLILSGGKSKTDLSDRVILKHDYVNKSDNIDTVTKDKGKAQKATTDILNSQLKEATAAFDKQMNEDGWAGDVADGVSVLWGSDNRASKVRVDLANYKREIADLQKASKQGDTQYKTKFKQVFGVEYNAHNIAIYQQYPTEANYSKAFGTKNNIAARIAKYNQSQQTGAAVVKGAATVVAGIAVGVATGGTGLVAMAAATAATSFAVNASDRVTSHVGLKDGELADITKNSLIDGVTVFAGGAIGEGLEVVVKGTTTTATVLRATGNAVANVGVGAGAEYAQTGHVTLEGTTINASMAMVGAAAESGALKSVGNRIKGVLHKSEDINIHNSAQGHETPVDIQNKANANTSSSKEDLKTNESLNTENDIKTSNNNLKSKLGEKLYKSYQQINSMIDNIKTQADCISLKTIIEGKFSNFKAEMNALLRKLENKAKSLFSGTMDRVSQSSKNVRTNTNEPIGRQQVQSRVTYKTEEIPFDNIPMSNRVPGYREGLSMGQTLTPAQKKIYNDSYEAFMKSKDLKITHNASNILSQDDLLHSTSLDAILGTNKEEGILEKGVIPRELTGKEGAHYADGSRADTLTPLCSDFWDIKGNSTIKNYFDARNSHWNNVGESNFLPMNFNDGRSKQAIILVFDKKSINSTLVENSFNVNNSGQSILFKNGNMSRGHDYPTHRAIPIGTPSNSIAKVIVDPKFYGQKNIDAIKLKAQAQGLNIKIFDYDGNQV